MNSVYGFKDDEYDDEWEEFDETAQKDHKALNRLKRDVGKFKEETQNNVIDLRSTLIINDMLMSENVIVAEASKPTEIIISHPIEDIISHTTNANSKDLIGIASPLFKVLIRSRN